MKYSYKYSLRHVFYKNLFPGYYNEFNKDLRKTNGTKKEIPIADLIGSWRFSLRT